MSRSLFVTLTALLLTGCPSTPAPPSDIPSIQRELRKDPKNPQLQKQAGDLFSRSGRYREAFQRYERAIELDPKYRAAYTASIALGWRTKTWGPLPAIYLKALRAGIELKDPYKGLGLTYYQLGENQQGVQALRRHLRRHPELQNPEGIFKAIRAMRARMRRGMPRGRTVSTVKAEWLEDMGDGR